MKHISALTFLAAVIFLGTGIAQAEEFSFPSDKPKVSVTFPDEWKTEPDGDVLHAYPKDESIYFGFIPLPEGTSSEDVGKAIGGAIDEIVTDLKEGEDSTETVNGIKLFISDATAKDKDTGNPVNVSLVWFSPDEDKDHMFGIVYLGTDEAEKKHGKEIKSIIASIKNPGTKKPSKWDVSEK